MPKIDIKLNPPRVIWFFLGSLFCLTEMIVLFLPLIFWQKISLFLVVGMYGGWSCFRFQLTHQLIQTIQWRDEKWLLLNKTGAYFATLRGDSVVTPWIILLRFQIQHTRKVWTAIVSKERVTADEFRQLIVHAKTS